MIALARLLARLAPGLALMAAGAAAHPASFEDTIAQRVLACTGCHGPAGRAGPDGYYPRIAGKPAGYLFRQLVAFRDGSRRYAPMTSLLRHLDDDYLREIAAHFAQQHPPHEPPGNAQVDAATLARGRRLVHAGDPARAVPACASCHGETLSGVDPFVPGLLGLPRDYLNAQLGAFRLGERRGHEPDCMGVIARRLAGDDVAALTGWLAAQAVAPDARPAPPDTATSSAIDCGPDAAVSATAAAAARAAASSAATRPGTQAAPAEASGPAVERGAYLARIGNCAGCHTLPGGPALAGGRPIETPFGPVHASNITPDPLGGIGRWSADDFWRALREGRRPDGRVLSPAFPYPWFARITRADSDALYAWLRSVPPSGRPNQGHALTFPFGTQAALLAWRFAFFRPPPERRAQGELGEYLVEGLAHCGACHGRRNAFGAVREPGRLDGATMPDGRWHAPALGGDERAIADYLRRGASASRTALGPMADVVRESTSRLDARDLDAMAAYLARVASRRAAPGARADGAAPAAATAEPGATLYERHCADCHGLDGRGRAGAYPPLAGNPTVLADRPTNLVRIVLEGGFAPVTAANPRPFGMPPFAQSLDRAAILAIVGHVRRSWGNVAAPLTASEIERQIDAGGR